MFPQEKQADVYWILQVCLNTVERGTEIGALFTFMPSFYVDAIMDSYNALKGYFHPTVKYTELQGTFKGMVRSNNSLSLLLWTVGAISLRRFPGKSQNKLSSQ